LIVDLELREGEMRVFTWIYGLPIPLVFLIFSGAAVAVAVGGTILFRKQVRKSLGPEPGKNDMVTMVLTVGGVFYGLLLGLVAAATYQSYDGANSVVASEAAALGTLYREISAYPEPIRGQLQKELKDYTGNVIKVAWPAQQKGQDPVGGTALVTRFQETLLAFEPQTKSQEILHAAAIEQFASFSKVRRERINDASGGIPDVLWWVLLLGGLVNLILLWMFSMDSLGAHLMLAGLFAFFLGMMVFLIAALDWPFRGDLSISADPFAAIYKNIMGG
jgi:hypothetical protein